MVRRMIQAGMNVARLNFSHGTFTSHKRLMQTIKKEAKELGKTVAILQDLQGPKIRIGDLPEEGIEVGAKEEVILHPIDKPCIPTKKKKCLPVGYSDLYCLVKKGDRIFIDDGLYEIEVTKVSGKIIYTRVVNGGTITGHKGINLPDATKVVSSLTDKDKNDLEFGIKSNVDFVALSFVQTAEDIKELKKLIVKHEKKHGTNRKTGTKIIAKIEKRQAIENIDAILEETDGIMVARGDLGIETPLQDVPLLQKEIIEKCLNASKPVITATQMLNSMIENPRPTRAEVSDVANAVIDHTDAVMLSAESASGRYPVESVQTMKTIIQDTEESPYDDLSLNSLNRTNLPIDVAVSNSAVRLAKNASAHAILIATLSGHTARIVSSYRPELPIIVTAHDDKVIRQLMLSWGIVPQRIPYCKSVDELIDKAVKEALKTKRVKKNERLIIIGGQPVGKSGNVNLIKVHEVEE